MANDYIDSLNKLANKRQLVLLKRAQLQVIKLYAQVAEEYYEKFVSRIGDDRAITALRLEYTRELAKQLDALTKEYVVTATDNASSVIADIWEPYYDEYKLRDTGFEEAVKRITRVASDKAAQRIIAGGIYKDGKGLSRRIWNSANASGKKIQEVIAAGMAKQLSAVEMAKTLETFMKPGTATYWDKQKIKELLGPGYAAWNKNITYEALRLARTTITHAATLAMKEAAKTNPYLTHGRWHSVHATGRTCQQCKDRDGKLYAIRDVPFDHPNGMCWVEPVLSKTLDEIGDDVVAWVNGESNTALDKIMQQAATLS